MSHLPKNTKSPSAYEVLGVTPLASTHEIRLRYRSLSKRAHPDRNGATEAAHELFLQIQAAYQILIDPEKRMAYDRDPTGKLESEMVAEKLKARRRRRKERLRRLYP